MKRAFFIAMTTVALALLAVPLLLRRTTVQASRPTAGGETLLLRPDNPLNYKMADSAIRLLRDGDLVLRSGADATSTMLRLMNRQDRRFSHCGLVMVENGEPFVYHSIGGEDNPDEKLRREPARDFFSPLNNEAIGIARLQLDAAQIRDLKKVVRAWQREGRRFDLRFDLGSDGRLYCSEMVCKAVWRATADTTYFPLSERSGRRYIGIDDLFLNEHARLTCYLRYR